MKNHPIFRIIPVSSLLMILAFNLFTFCTPEKYDLVIRNGLIYDGSGSEPFKADLAVSEEKIVKVGSISKDMAVKEIEAAGLVVAPGFIDMHVHLHPLMRLPQANSQVRQGVTTSVGGPDGGSPWPLGDYLDSLEKISLGMNVAYLVGHNTIRSKVMGLENRDPSHYELQQMKTLVREGMEAGAFGISTGLFYLPGTFSKVKEVIELAREAGEMGGIYTSHLRDEATGLIEGVAEAIRIGDEAKIPVVLTHHKAMGVKMWGASKVTLAMVDSARKRNIDVMLDQYPYAASRTSLKVLIPAWALADDPVSGFAKRCEDPVVRDSIKQGIIYNFLNNRGGDDLRRVQFSALSWKPELEGKTLHDWLVMEDIEPTVENAAEKIIEAQIKGGGSAIYHVMNEEDVVRIMQHPMTMIGSDGTLSSPGNGHPHPRSYGTFPRILGKYVREEKVFSLETAIHKMTGLSAKRLGLDDRGLIKNGFYADLVVFDPERIADRATFDDPHQYPQGIEYVVVNGMLAVEKGELTGKFGGKILRGPAWVD